MTKQIVLGFLVALVGALVAVSVDAPIPWMLGSLILTAIFKVNGANIHCHAAFRKIGQWIIGIALGLYFGPETIAIIRDLLPYVLAGCVFALAIGLVGSAILYQWGRVDYTTAFFSSTVGGASEMVVLAHRYGSSKMQLVASAHSLRVLIIVVSIPFIYQILGVKGDVESHVAMTFFSWSGLLKLAAISGVVCLALDRINMPNAMMLGALFVTILLTANGIVFTHLRPEIQNLGQLLIGWSLGSNYRPGFLRQAPRFFAAVGLMTTVYLILAFVFCVAVAHLSGIDFPTAVLAMSPGGIAEMAITAKVLMLGAPIVTSFQVCRLIFILLTVGPSYKLINSYLNNK